MTELFFTPGLQLKCDRCKASIDSPGALVFSPPQNKETPMTTLKFHVCTGCWKSLEAFFHPEDADLLH